MYMEENADIRPAVPLRAQQTRPASTGLLWRTTGVSACKPFHHSFLSFPSNYHNFFFSFFNFIRHSAGCTVTAKLPISGSSPLSASVLHCWTAMVQTVVENSRLRPSGVKTSTCTKKKNNPTHLPRTAIRLVGRHGRVTHISFAISATRSPCTLLFLHVQIIAFRKQKK